MGRAQGKRTPRGVLDSLTGGPGGTELSGGEERELGIGDERDIPGGAQARPHIGNPEAERQPVPVPAHEWPYRRALLAHGVPPDGLHHDREVHGRPEGGQHGHPDYHLPVPAPSAVPVYIVERAGQKDSLRTASPRMVTCPASTAAEPVRVCGRNADRIEIQLLNESQSSNIRFGHDLAVLAAGRGALLPWPSNSYVTVKTQDELFAISADSGTPALSIVEVFQGEAGS